MVRRRALPLLISFGITFLASLTASHGTSAQSLQEKTEVCASCHGADGLSKDPTIPIIQGQSAAYIEKQLRDYKNGDRDSQIMSSMAESLRDAEIPQVAADLASRPWPIAQAATSSEPIPDAIATCQTCHGVALTGGNVNGDIAPRIAGQHDLYLSETIASFADGTRSNSAIMTSIAQALSSDERDRVARYVAALR